MIKKYKNLIQESEINITPMLDVVFIMLIFFIVTTSFNKETGFILYKYNNWSHSPKVKNAVIRLDAQNNHSVNGVATSIDGIESLLANLKASNPDLGAQIIASQEVKTGDLVQAIHQIKMNAITKYSVSSY